jgi:hypothetical protein
MKVPNHGKLFKALLEGPSECILLVTTEGIQLLLRHVLTLSKLSGQNRAVTLEIFFWELFG